MPGLDRVLLPFKLELRGCANGQHPPVRMFQVVPPLEGWQNRRAKLVVVVNWYLLVGEYHKVVLVQEESSWVRSPNKGTPLEEM